MVSERAEKRARVSFLSSALNRLAPDHIAYSFSGSPMIVTDCQRMHREPRAASVRDPSSAKASARSSCSLQQPTSRAA